MSGERALTKADLEKALTEVVSGPPVEPPDLHPPSNPDPDWRSKMTHPVKFTEEAKSIYLDDLARFGRKKMSATAAGVNMSTIQDHRKNDDHFAQAEVEALETYKDRVRQAVYEYGVTGMLEPVFGGKFKNQIVGYKRIVSPAVTILEAKRVDETYRERAQLDVNHKGGVLLIPTGMSSDEWEKKFAKPPKELTSDEAQVQAEASPPDNAG